MILFFFEIINKKAKTHGDIIVLQDTVYYLLQ